jgi:hypothetical protein
MIQTYPIFVLDASIDESEIDYYQAVDWCYENLEHPNVLMLSEDDIFSSEVKSILEIVNDVNGSMITYGENDWIIDNEIKQELIEELEIYAKRRKVTRNEKSVFIITQLVILLKVAIATDHNIFFHF